MKKIKLTVFLLLSVFSAAFAQFSNGGGAVDIPNGEFNDPMRRIGPTGIGGYNSTFPLPTSLLQVRANGTNSQISHVEQGTFGAFASGSQWLGLGLAGVGTAYGLAIAQNTSTGVFNLLSEGSQTNLIAGFGSTASTNTNRFKIRGFSGTSFTSRDLLIANPNGAVGINEEPQSTFWVNSTLSNSDSVRVKAIAIKSRQPLFSGNNITSASAIGVQANVSLAQSEIAVEGFRAQIPDFQTVLIAPQGVATNL